MADRTDRLRNVAVPSHHLFASTTTGAVSAAPRVPREASLFCRTAETDAISVGQPGAHARWSCRKWRWISAASISGKAEEDIREVELELKEGYGCSTLSTEGPLEECVDTAESGGVAILIER